MLVLLVLNNQDKILSQNAVHQKWLQLCQMRKKTQQQEEKEEKTQIQIEKVRQKWLPQMNLLVKKTLAIKK